MVILLFLAVQIAQEVENVIRHAKMNAKSEETDQSEEAGSDDKKTEKDGNEA